MGKIEKLLDKTKRNGETKKWKMYLFAVIGILVVVGGFFGAMTLLNPIVDSYIQKNKDIVNLYDFYDTKVGEDTTAVYFIGSSYVGYSVNPKEINNILLDKGFEGITVYSLPHDADRPRERLLELRKIIESKPSLVILGGSYGELCDTDQHQWNEERAILVHDKLTVDNPTLNILTDEEKQTLYEEPSMIYKKKFLFSCLKELFTSSPKKTMDLLTDPYGDEYRKKQIGTPVDSPKLGNSSILTYSNVGQNQALKYIITELQKNGISVAFVLTPRSPYLIPDSEVTENNFWNFLDDTGINIYDLGSRYNNSLYHDGRHMTLDGSYAVAPA